jgi:hypothetical protein
MIINLLRACLDFIFEPTCADASAGRPIVAKYSSEQGAMRDYSLSYATDDQRFNGQYWTQAGRSIRSKHALN